MTAYMVVMLDTTNQDWVADYRRDVPSLVEAAGGRYLSFPAPPQRVEGSGYLPQTMALLSFPSMVAARDFLGSAQYRPYAEARQAGAQTTIYLAEGTPPSD